MSPTCRTTFSFKSKKSWIVSSTLFLLLGGFEVITQGVLLENLQRKTRPDRCTNILHVPKQALQCENLTNQKLLLSRELLFR